MVCYATITGRLRFWSSYSGYLRAPWLVDILAESSSFFLHNLMPFFHTINILCLICPHMAVPPLQFFPFLLSPCFSIMPYDLSSPAHNAYLSYHYLITYLTIKYHWCSIPDQTLLVSTLYSFFPFLPSTWFSIVPYDLCSLAHNTYSS